MRILTFAYNLQCPPEADLVVDCRVLEEPYHPRPVYRSLVSRALAYLVDHPEATVAFGCSWGQQRSVTTAERVAGLLGARVEHLSPARFQELL